MARAKSSPSPYPSSATIGFEAKRWLAADNLHNNRDAAISREATPVPQARAYTHVVLGLIHSVAPHDRADFVLANGSMSYNQSGEGNIRRAGRKFSRERTSLFSAN